MKKVRPLDETVKVMFRDQEFHNLFRYNQFTEDIEYIRPPVWDKHVSENKILDDDDLTDGRYFLSTHHNIEPTKQIIGEAFFITSKVNRYHPVKQYILTEKWDGTPRLDNWIVEATGCDNNVYTRQAGAKFLIAAVNRVFNPGCKFDHMMILEGGQGIGKSTLVEELAGQWYLDTNFESHDKDLIDMMRKAFIIEISELSGMNQKDVNWLKAFLTKKVDRVRLAYAVRSKDFKRKSVFIGTYNPSGNNTYLRDDTGNRRFWPIECKKINLPYVKQVKAQLWAEAYDRYIKNERYYIDDPEALTILKGLHEDRELEGPTYYKLKEWLNGIRRPIVTMNDILIHGMGINIQFLGPKELQSHWTIAGIILRKLKWTKGSNMDRDKYYAPGHDKVTAMQMLREHNDTETQKDWSE